MNYFRMSLIAGERSISKDTSRQLRPRHDEIARLAYYLYEVRGRGDGRDLEDWLLAEAELNRHVA